MFGTYRMCDTREGMIPKLLPKISAFNINGKTTHGGKKTPRVAEILKAFATHGASFPPFVVFPLMLKALIFGSTFGIIPSRVLHILYVPNSKKKHAYMYHT